MSRAVFTPGSLHARVCPSALRCWNARPAVAPTLFPPKILSHPAQGEAPGCSLKKKCDKLHRELACLPCASRSSTRDHFPPTPPTPFIVETRPFNTTLSTASTLLATAVSACAFLPRSALALERAHSFARPAYPRLLRRAQPPCLRIFRSHGITRQPQTPLRGWRSVFALSPQGHSRPDPSFFPATAVHGMRLAMERATAAEQEPAHSRVLHAKEAAPARWRGAGRSPRWRRSPP